MQRIWLWESEMLNTGDETSLEDHVWFKSSEFEVQVRYISKWSGEFEMQFRQVKMFSRQLDHGRECPTGDTDQGVTHLGALGEHYENKK